MNMKTILILALTFLASASASDLTSSVRAASKTETTSKISLKQTSEAPNRIRKRASQIDIVQNTATNERQRRLSGWWSVLSKVLPCPPGPLGHICHKGTDGSGSGSGSSNSGGSGGSGSSSSSSSSGGSGSSSSSAGGGASSATSSSSGGDDGGSGSGSGVGNKIQAFMTSPDGKIGAIIAASVAASVAIGAMYMGSKRRVVKTENHSLHGTLKRRITMFTRMAGRTKCGTCRPEMLEDAVVGENLKGRESGGASTEYRLA